ncbi:enoyl-CoA hydratase/isomerase domain-containing protein [Ditylenchus destructor]|nr:enoyl-CoA hydratase/isomerase domain-containing protein [Ditylenchus destructor]
MTRADERAPVIPSYYTLVTFSPRYLPKRNNKKVSPSDSIGKVQTTLQPRALKGQCFAVSLTMLEKGVPAVAVKANSDMTPSIIDEVEPAFFEYKSGEYKGVIVGHLSCRRNRNALSYAMVKALNKKFDDIKNDRNARVLILKSDVSDVFCAGADLRERKTMTVDEIPVFVAKLQALMNKLADLPIPVIAAIDGVAIGGGLEMALACDIRISTPTSLMGLVETRLGVIPGAGGTQRLSRLLGIAKAKELIFTGTKLSGVKAAQLGLVNCAVEDPYIEALDMAKQILKGGPMAIRAAKMAIDRGFDVDLDSAMIIEQEGYAQIVRTKDRVEGLKAFFEKREPVYIVLKRLRILGGISGGDPENLRKRLWAIFGIFNRRRSGGDFRKCYTAYIICRIMHSGLEDENLAKCRALDCIRQTFAHPCDIDTWHYMYAIPALFVVLSLCLMNQNNACEYNGKTYQDGEEFPGFYETEFIMRCTHTGKGWRVRGVFCLDENHKRVPLNSVGENSASGRKWLCEMPDGMIIRKTLVGEGGASSQMPFRFRHTDLDYRSDLDHTHSNFNMNTLEFAQVTVISKSPEQVQDLQNQSPMADLPKELKTLSLEEAESVANSVYVLDESMELTLDENEAGVNTLEFAQVAVISKSPDQTQDLQTQDPMAGMPKELKTLSLEEAESVAQSVYVLDESMELPLEENETGSPSDMARRKQKKVKRASSIVCGPKSPARLNLNQTLPARSPKSTLEDEPRRSLRTPVKPMKDELLDVIFFHDHNLDPNKFEISCQKF